MTPRTVMLGVLAAVALLVLISFWRAHRDALAQFNAFDLIMENGRASKIAVAFMLVLGVSTWVIVLLAIRDKLSEGMFGLWLAAWTGPLVAKVIFGKNDMPGTTTSTLMQQTTTEMKP